MQFLWLMCFLVPVFTLQNFHLRGNIPINHNDKDYYYWRDYRQYTGDIPPDALPGGYNDRDKPLYFGQFTNSETGVLIFGKISSQFKEMYYAINGKELGTLNNVKILCTPYPERFHWIETKGIEAVTTVEQDNKELIIDNLVAFGRKSVNDSLEVGIVYIVNGTFQAINLTKDGEAWLETSFEILVYNPPKSKHEEGSSVKETIIY